jgi:hypothetical protein
MRTAAANGFDPTGGARLSHGLQIRTADLSRARPPRWAWQDWVAIGYLNLLVGNEGVGKGTLVAYVIAELTRGQLPGSLHDQPVNVGILGDEDNFDNDWTPRLHAAGAVLDRVVQIERPDGGYITLRDDRAEIAGAVADERIGVLFFDQLLDHLGVSVDDWRQKQVREALRPLRILARELEIATLGCLHPNKRGDSFRQLIAGTAAFNAVSRSSLLLAQHPEDEDLRVLVRGKGNLSRTPPAIQFRLESCSFSANGHTFEAPRAAGFEVVPDVTVDDLLDSDKAREQSKIRDACEIIEALLPRDDKWHLAAPILDACQSNDIDERIARRARNRLRVQHRHVRKFPAPVEWRWPTTQLSTADTREPMFSQSGVSGVSGVGDDAPGVSGVSGVSGVGADDARNPLRSSSPATPDTADAATRVNRMSGQRDELERWAEEGD